MFNDKKSKMFKLNNYLPHYLKVIINPGFIMQSGHTTFFISSCLIYIVSLNIVTCWFDKKKIIFHLFLGRDTLHAVKNAFLLKTWPIDNLPIKLSSLVCSIKDETYFIIKIWSSFCHSPSKIKCVLFYFEFFNVNQHASQHFIFEKFIQALGPSGESRVPDCKTKQSAKF